MPMTDGFRDLIAQMAAGIAFTAYDNAGAYFGVGNGADAFNAAHTDLQGVSKERRPMKVGFPTRNNNVLVFEARFLELEGVFAWLEGGIFNDPAAGIMMCRFLDDQGVKPNDEIWDYEVTVTVSHV